MHMTHHHNQRNGMTLNLHRNETRELSHCSKEYSIEKINVKSFIIIMREKLLQIAKCYELNQKSMWKGFFATTKSVDKLQKQIEEVGRKIPYGHLEVESDES